MKKIGLTVGLALAMTTLIVGWSAWRGGRAMRGASPPSKPLAQASYGDVVINEVGWMGTAASSADEWIELYNTTDHPITLTNWRLCYRSVLEHEGHESAKLVCGAKVGQTFQSAGQSAVGKVLGVFFAPRPVSGRLSRWTAMSPAT